MGEDFGEGGLPIQGLGMHRRVAGDAVALADGVVEAGQALGGVLKHRFEALHQQHEAEAAGTARKALTDPNAYDLTALNEPQRKALIRFWEAWPETLKQRANP